MINHQTATVMWLFLSKQIYSISVVYTLVWFQCHPHCRRRSLYLQRMFEHILNLFRHLFHSFHVWVHSGWLLTSMILPKIWIFIRNCGAFDLLNELLTWSLKVLRVYWFRYLSPISCSFIEWYSYLAAKLRRFYQRFLLEANCFIINCAYCN